VADPDPARTWALHRRALDLFDDEVHAVAPEQWGAPTPCSEWDVRQLVGHLADEQYWAVALLEGRSLADAQAYVPADPLAGDPLEAWERAADAARRVLVGPDVLAGTVELSYGPTPAADYVAEMTTDLVVHGWDLARATGQDEAVDGELLEVTWARVEPRAKDIAGSDMFSPSVPVDASADLQTRLLALLGRRA
jgi:uncharacterized protein (TIGR03086 family)